MLAGAIFEIRNDSDTVVDTITSNANGVATSKNLPLGDYTVKELKPPADFVPNDTVYNVTVAYKDANTPVVEVEMTIENEPIRGKIRVIKLAQGEATPIEGATFEPVSYTHLDVYKRQPFTRANLVAMINEERARIEMCIRDRCNDLLFVFTVDHENGQRACLRDVYKRQFHRCVHRREARTRAQPCGEQRRRIEYAAEQ